jgi:hypothetical protein
LVVEPSAALDELRAKVAKVGYRPTEGRHAKGQKGEENLEHRAS